MASHTIAEINKLRATIKLKPPEEPIIEKEPEIAKRYIVKAGDTLSKIAYKFYKDSSKWVIIYRKNKDKIRNPNRIKPGLELIIP